MKYKKIVKATFVDRPNRFVSNVILNSEQIPVHVKNTGRCKELLVAGYEVYLEDHRENSSRKYSYDLIAVNKNGLLINMDSQAPNQVVKEALLDGTLCFPELGTITLIRPETTFGDSRFDFYLEGSLGPGFLEVKGCTLESDGFCSFPDAPTERGVKHLHELIEAKKQGFFSGIIFVIQMEGMKSFSPNTKTHPDFAKALIEAKKAGVLVLAKECKVTEDSLSLAGDIPVVL